VGEADISNSDAADVRRSRFGRGGGRCDSAKYVTVNTENGEAHDYTTWRDPCGEELETLFV